jgi:hypothetical protein
VRRRREARVAVEGQPLPLLLEDQFRVQDEGASRKEKERERGKGEGAGREEGGRREGRSSSSS